MPAAPAEALPLYVITSRDRPREVEAAIGSIREFDGSRRSASTRIWVVDDSTRPDNRAELQLVVRRAQEYAEVRYVGSQTSIGLDGMGRPLGSPGWNLASARNAASVLMIAELPANQLVCMLDDDVRLSPATCDGVPLRPRLGTVFSDATLRATNGELFATGPVFLGREDISLTRHLAKASLTPQRATPPKRSFMPVHLATKHAHLEPQPQVPSGGLLLTTPATLALAPLFPAYNEDWLWGLLIGTQRGVTVRRTRDVALHVPPAEPWPGKRRLVYQEVGEILYDAVETAVRAHGRPRLDVPTVAAAKRRHLARLSARAATVAGCGRYRGRAHSLLTATERSLAALAPEELVASFTSWCGQIERWRRISGDAAPSEDVIFA